MAYGPAMSSALARPSGSVFSASDPNRPTRGLRPLNDWHYVFATYVPTAIAVALHAVVAYMNASAKLMQPFVALAAASSGAKPRRANNGSQAPRVGVPAAAFFHVGHLSAIGALDPVLALFRSHSSSSRLGKQTMLAASAMLYLAIGLCAPPLASELLAVAPFCYVHTSAAAVRGGSGKRYLHCGPEIRMNYTVGRMLQALLSLAAAVLLALLVVALRRRSAAAATAAAIRRDPTATDTAATAVVAGTGGGRCGGCGGCCSVYQDPSAIATLASLLHHPAVLADFRRVDPDATKEEQLRALTHRRYALGWYKAPAGGGERYGVVPVLRDEALSTSATAHQTRGMDEGESVGKTVDCIKCRDWGQHRRIGHRQRVLRLAARDVLLAAVTAGKFAIILVYYTNRNPKNKLEQFLISQKFGPRFLMSVVGIFLLGQWKRIERGEWLYYEFHS